MNWQFSLVFEKLYNILCKQFNVIEKVLPKAHDVFGMKSGHEQTLTLTRMAFGSSAVGKIS